ncbi:AI-2E family transporter [Candidatus Saccharibacteria bacterium]|nr:AI-2E family transporter [Candidatus Saccharibacteria bacterium]
MSHQIVEIETKTFIRFWLVILGFFAVGFFLFKAREALAIIAVAALLAIAIRPLAVKFNKYIGKKTHSKAKLPSVLAYLLVVLVIAAIVAVVGPIVVNEMIRFVSSLPSMVNGANLEGLNELGRSLGISDLSGEIGKSVEEFSKSFLASFGTSVVSGISVLSGIISKAVVTLIMTLFFLLEGPEMVNELWEKLGARENASEAKDSESKILTEARFLVSKMAWVVSTFVDKKVLVAVIDGVAVMISIFILSAIFHVEARLALPMGMIATIFCIIPMFGQIIGAAIITLLLLLTNPVMAFVWLAFYIVYGVIESNIFEPKIQGSALNLRPIVVLIAITIGTYTLGLFGTIIAIPIAGCVKVLVDEYPRIREISKH